MLKRPGEQRGSRRRRRQRRDAWWAVTAAVVLGCAAAAAFVPAPVWVRGAAAALAVTAVCGVAAALRLRATLAGTRAALRRAEETAGARGAELAHLARVRMPAIAERVRNGERLDGVPGPVAPPAVTGEEFARALAAVVTGLGSDEAVRRERTLRDSVQAAFESVARTMHAMATVQQQVLDHVEQLVSDPRLMSEVMKADHAAAQMTRKAQTLLVMCGIWPARRETRPVTLYDCVRGAQSRIVEFARVEVHGGQSLYVVPPAVEGLMHAVAELLENATVFSPSRTQVVVTVREVGAGAVLEIDDAGLGMPPDVLQQAVGQLRDDLDLARLGAVPRLGLACVGRWARELGFNVDLTGASAYGGTRAVVFVPHRLLTEPLPETAGRPAAAHAYPAPPPEAAPATPPAARPPLARPPAEPAPVRPAAPAQAAEPSAAGALPPPLPRRRNRRRAVDPLLGYGDAPAPPGGAPVPARPSAPERVLPPGQPSAPGRATPPPATGHPWHDAPAPPGPAARPLPDAAPPRPAWSPEAARASVASVVTGSRRGRAEATGDGGFDTSPTADAPAPEPLPSRPASPAPPQRPDDHEGGRA
ncbi:MULTISPECIES: ATP-binding protein [Streptomyces]|uniref:ATP-binding protein n=1 Tax=Streptomyces TaxID=1883 RepID=UPI002B0551B1|nr:ATP-binding protein [Streptomyces sp. JHD 1]